MSTNSNPGKTSKALAQCLPSCRHEAQSVRRLERIDKWRGWRSASGCPNSSVLEVCQLNVQKTKVS